jgi:hypothetical protein
MRKLLILFIPLFLGCCSSEEEETTDSSMLFYTQQEYTGIVIGIGSYHEDGYDRKYFEMEDASGNLHQFRYGETDLHIGDSVKYTPSNEEGHLGHIMHYGRSKTYWQHLINDD